MFGLAGEQARAVCRAVLAELESTFPDRVTVTIEGDSRATVVTADGPNGSSIELVPMFGTPIPLPRSLSAKFAAISVVEAIQGVVRQVGPGWPLARSAARAGVEGDTVRAWFEDSEGGVVEIGRFGLSMF